MTWNWDRWRFYGGWCALIATGSKTIIKEARIFSRPPADGCFSPVGSHTIPNDSPVLNSGISVH
jgi:hypothetical protein